MAGCALHQGHPQPDCSFCRFFTVPTQEELVTLTALENWKRLIEKVLVASGARQPPNQLRVMSQASDARRIGEELGITLGSSPHPIPQIIHRFWTGGPMSGTVMTLLAEAGEQARAAGWQCYLWYSLTVEDALTAKLGEERCMLRQFQRDTLERTFGYQICFVEGLGPSGVPGAVHVATEEQIVSLAQRAARSVIQGNNWDDVKYFSDLARLLYLYGLGGFHMDVDVGLGRMDLTQQYRHNDPAGEIPLLGTLARDNSDTYVASTLAFIEKARNAGVAERDKYELAVGAMVDRAVNGAGMFNALIASRPRTNHLRLAIAEYLRRNALFSGMSLQRILLVGNGGADAQEMMKYTVPPYLLALRHLTPESDA